MQMQMGKYEKKREKKRKKIQEKSIVLTSAEC